MSIALRMLSVDEKTLWDNEMEIVLSACHAVRTRCALVPDQWAIPSIEDCPLLRRRLACVYVASFAETCRVGYAEDLAASITRLQRICPVALSVESAIWVPDRGIAAVIAKAVQCDLTAHKKPGGWLSCDPVTAAQAVEIAAFRVYPNATMVTHEQLISQWKAKRAA